VRSEPELEDDVRTLVAALREAGEANWARMLERCIDRESERLIHMGHALAILLERGPQKKEPLASARDRIEQLLVDVVALWPPRG
jgi:hypothetical protein